MLGGRSPSSPAGSSFFTTIRALHVSFFFFLKYPAPPDFYPFPLPAPFPISFPAFLVVVFAIFGPGFPTPANILNIGVQSSVLLLLALPMTLIIMTEGLDLSMGAVLSLAGVVMADVLMHERGLGSGLAAALSVGLAFGIANGILVTALGLPAFVATLGTLGI